MMPSARGYATSAFLLIALATLGHARVADLPSLRPVLEIKESPDIQSDPATGNYKVFYQALDGTRKYWIFEPASKVKVSVESAARFDSASGEYVYTYTVYTREDSPQRTRRFGVEYGEAGIFGVSSPAGWMFSASCVGRPVLIWGDTEVSRHGIAPGASQSGFGFRSKSPPGTVKCYAAGYVPIPYFPESAPDDPRPKFFGNCVAGETVGPVPGTASEVTVAWVALAEALPGEQWHVTWDNESKTALATRGATSVQVQVGNFVAFVNGRPVPLPAAPRVSNGRVQVPDSIRAHIAP